MSVMSRARRRRNVSFKVACSPLLLETPSILQQLFSVKLWFNKAIQHNLPFLSDKGSIRIKHSSLYSI